MKRPLPVASVAVGSAAFWYFEMIDVPICRVPNIWAWAVPARASKRSATSTDRVIRNPSFEATCYSRIYQTGLSKTRFSMLETVEQLWNRYGAKGLRPQAS